VSLPITSGIWMPERSNGPPGAPALAGSKMCSKIFRSHWTSSSVVMRSTFRKPFSLKTAISSRLGAMSKEVAGGGPNIISAMLKC